MNCKGPQTNMPQNVGSNVTWRDSVGVGVQCQDLNQIMNSVYYAILTSHNNGGTAIDGYNPALFWVLLVSC